MFANINTEVSLSETTIHIYTISISRSSINKEKTYYQHRHPGFELHYVQCGQCKITCCSKSHSLKQGNLILIPPGMYHDVIAEKNETVRLCISFDMHHKKATGGSESHCDVFDKNTPAVIELQNSEATYALNRIYQMLESRQNDSYTNDKLSALCSNLLLELIPCLITASKQSNSAQLTAKPEDRNYKIDTFLGTNFMHNNAKSRMASNLYISPRQLQRIIQKNYGMSYRQKLSETRVQIAIDLLTNSDTPIHKISEILGYSCSANFSAFIKRVTGKTPSQIRKEH